MVLRLAVAAVLFISAAGCELFDEQNKRKPGWSSEPPKIPRAQRAQPIPADPNAPIPRGSSVAEDQQPLELPAPFATTP